MQICPPPRKISFQKKILQLRQRHHILIQQPLSERLTGTLLRMAEKNPVLTISYSELQTDSVLLRIRQGGEKTEGAYSLRAGEGGIDLVANSESGTFYGLMTLQQILAQATDEIQCFNIEDHPDFQQRGVMLDISRCKVPTVKSLKTLIDQFAGLKINQLQLYTEHTFAFRHHQQVWADASPLNSNDILSLKHYCNERFINLVPNLNSFGHFERWLKHPQYHQYAECPDGFTHPWSQTHFATGSTLRPNQKSLALLNELYREYLPLFDGDLFNIGGDEPWELGLGWSKRKCSQKGSTQVYVDFLARINQLSNRHHRRTQFWSDIVLRQPSCLDQLPKNMIALNWGYEGDHPFKRECEHMAEQHLEFYVCPGTSSWNSLTGRIENAKKNLANAARNGLKTGAAGYLVTDWGDHGHHQYLPISYPGFVLAAGHSWNHKATQRMDLAEAVNLIFLGEADLATAELLIRLGEVPGLAPSKIRNATIFNRTLFWSMRDEPSATQGLSDGQLHACINELSSICEKLRHSAQPDLKLVQDELRNASKMAIHGLQRLLLFRSNSVKKQNLDSDIHGIMAEHERLWLARNASGGLRESLQHLAKTIEPRQ
ncbi:MAG: family 20 glycosylhydrolase [Gammaproteobacteria bacterium]|jgi:hexosaminidase|nr:family 20 glycosylhydrolase [Gammaproteobacteria bacterium]MBT5204574.1 family 20 glycosylhydrolase [Gammaproteobacteria bacterium]MBT5604070.1 family 20 glycosylhydrolase [Gammaproteobacteria bacterium]MBT6244838.1 family 20 glycosylhydrolase [Gammaproteobacteria bacterium]